MRPISHYNVLLVDDDRQFRQSLKRTLDSLNSKYVVTSDVDNGADALRILQSQTIHLVITEIKMPVMNGLDLARTIKERYADIPVIFLSSHSYFTYAQQAIREHVFEYLLKPVSVDELSLVLSRVQIVLDKTYTLPDQTIVGNHDAKSRVDYLVSYIQQHYMEAVDLGKLADQFGFSSAYLSKIFKHYTGSTPLKILTEVRIHHAKRLLNQTNLTIQEVGEEVGYPDRFYFSKAFHKIVGVSPSNYRTARGSSDS